MSSGRRERHIDKTRIQIDGRNIGEHHREIFLFLPELAKRRGDVGGGDDGGCDLVEQRLKDVVVAAVDQYDLGIGVPQRVCRGNPGKAATDDHDTLLLPCRRFWRRHLLSRASLFKGYSHFGHLVARALRTPGSKTARLPFSRRGPLRWVPYALARPWRAVRAARAGPRRAPPPNHRSCASPPRREHCR